MGCINNIKIQDKKYSTSVITSNQLISKKKENENRKYSQPLNEPIFSKRQFEDIPQAHITQTIDDLIENNPLPFVKIRRKKKSF